MNLSGGAKHFATLPNAGGSSVVSEMLSFELFKCLFNAQFISTELEIVYFPEGGSLVDYLI